MNRWYDERNDMNVVYLSLPAGINEAVTPNADGSFTAFISTRLSAEKRLKAYQHALWHVQHDDFGRDEDVDQIEYKAHIGSVDLPVTDGGIE